MGRQKHDVGKPARLCVPPLWSDQTMRARPGESAAVRNGSTSWSPSRKTREIPGQNGQQSAPESAEGFRTALGYGLRAGQPGADYGHGGRRST